MSMKAPLVTNQFLPQWCDNPITSLLTVNTYLPCHHRMVTLTSKAFTPNNGFIHTHRDTVASFLTELTKPICLVTYSSKQQKKITVLKCVEWTVPNCIINSPQLIAWFYLIWSQGSYETWHCEHLYKIHWLTTQFDVQLIIIVVTATVFWKERKQKTSILWMFIFSPHFQREWHNTEGQKSKDC